MDSHVYFRRGQLKLSTVIIKYNCAISEIGNISVSFGGVVGFEFAPYRVILETLKHGLLLLCQTCDINTKSRGRINSVKPSLKIILKR